jgi:proline iminopeptidase
MTRRVDLRWFATETGRFFPEQWAAFRAAVPPGDRDDLVAAYDGLLNGRSAPAVQLMAARDWVAWEDAVLSLDDGYVVPNPRYLDDRFTVAFARLVTHYFSHAAWLGEDELLRNASRLVGIPGVLIHGRLDIAGPPDVAWQLAQAWPDAELHLIESGHTGSVEADRIIRESTDKFAR